MTNSSYKMKIKRSKFGDQLIEPFQIQDNGNNTY